MDRFVVIANPVASQFTGGVHRDVMSVLARSHDVEAVWPSTPQEAGEIAARVADQGASVVIAMGGDGMAHHVSQGLVGRQAALGIIPVGTTNVVARLLKIPSRPAKAVKLIQRSPGALSLGVVRLDLSRGSTTTTHHAIFAAGFGLDAEVVVEADRDPYRKYRFGSVHYARTALGIGLGRFPLRKPHVHVSSVGRTADATTALFQFRDVYTYFGKIPLRIDDEPPDPMTVLVMGRLRRRRIPGIVLGSLGRRTLDSIEGIEIWPGISRVEISADPPVAAQADGEALGLIDGAESEWIPGALRVIAGP